MTNSLNERIIKMLVTSANRHNKAWAGKTKVDVLRLVVICENIATSTTNKMLFTQGMLTFAWTFYDKGLQREVTCAYSPECCQSYALNRKDYVNVGA